MPHRDSPSSDLPTAWHRCWRALTTGQQPAVGWPPKPDRADVDSAGDETFGLDAPGSAAQENSHSPAAPSVARYLFPGSFNPLHQAHRAIAAWVEQRLGRALEFELSIANVDKRRLTCEAAYRRVRQFDPQQTIWLTVAATFLEKARLFPASTFVVGADTVLRVADVRYYAGGMRQASAAWDELAGLDCTFLVFGRLVAGRFRDAADLSQLPPQLADRCQWVPGDAFRIDISSTELRRRR